MLHAFGCVLLFSACKLYCHRVQTVYHRFSQCKLNDIIKCICVVYVCTVKYTVSECLHKARTHIRIYVITYTYVRMSPLCVYVAGCTLRSCSRQYNILCAYICEVLRVCCNIGFIVAFKMCPLLQIMTGSALQRRVAGKGVTVSAIHPGIVS